MAFIIDHKERTATCESADTKPVEGVYLNMTCVELDTLDVYYFDGTEWKECGSLSE